MDNVHVSKKYGGIALSALLVFSVAAAVLVVPQAADAAVLIQASSNSFYGPGFVRVVITDTAKTSNVDQVIPTIEARSGSTVRGSVNPTFDALGTSGTFEFFITTSEDPLVPQNPTRTITGIPNAYVVRAYPGATNGANADTATGDGVNTNDILLDGTGPAAGLPQSAATNYGLNTGAYTMQSGDSFRVIYGGQTLNINFSRTTAVLTADRSVAGDGNEIVLSLADRDASLDPTLVNMFDGSATAAPFLSGAFGDVTLNDPFWQETGQNTGVFELTLTVNGGTNDLDAAPPVGKSFTIRDHDSYIDLTGSVNTHFANTIPSATSSTSVTIQNTDGQLSMASPLSVANGFQLVIVDPDRNISASEDDSFTQSVLITVDGINDGDSTNIFRNAAGVWQVGAGGGFTEIFGTIMDVDFLETGPNTGIFTPDLNNNSIPIFIVNTGSELVDVDAVSVSSDTISSTPDVTIIYLDEFGQLNQKKLFQVVTQITQTSGQLSTNTPTVTATGNVALTLAAPDLNTNTQTIETYVIPFNSAVNPVAFANGFADLRIQAKGTTIDFTGNQLTVTFIETGPNTGIFQADNIQMNIIAAAAAATAGIGNLSDGDPLNIRYRDNTVNPAQTSSVTITIGVPSKNISVDRSTIPIVRSGTTDVTKLTVTITDPSRGVNSNSVDTFNTGITMELTDKNGNVIANGPANLQTAGGAQTLPLNKLFIETGADTGVFTATYDIQNNHPTAGDRIANTALDNARLKITYTSGGTTVSATTTFRAYDGVVSASTTVVQNGNSLVLTVTDLTMNKDPSVAETLPGGQVTFRIESDPLTGVAYPVAINDIKETGPNTGVFTKTLVIGKDIRVSDVTTNSFGTNIKFQYTDQITSNIQLNQLRELNVRVSTSTGTMVVTPELVGPGTTLTITITDMDLNSNSEGVDTANQGGALEFVSITSDRAGANVMVMATAEEQGPNTGIFVLKLKLRPLPVNYNGQLFPDLNSNEIDGNVLPGDILSIRYTDQKNANGVKQVISKIVHVQSFDPDMSTNKFAVAPGESVEITIADPDRNTDSESVDSVQVRVTSDTDPVGVTITLLETGPDTGIFVGSATTTTGASAGSVSVTTGDNLTIKYNDIYPADYADRIKLVADPSKDFLLVIPIGAAASPTSTTPSAPAFKDLNGNTVTQVMTGQQVILSVDIQNNEQQSRTFAAIVEVRNADGITVYLQWQTGTIQPNGTANVGLSWSPDAPGQYTVRTFVLTQINNPSALSPIAQSTVTVS